MLTTRCQNFSAPSGAARNPPCSLCPRLRPERAKLSPRGLPDIDFPVPGKCIPEAVPRLRSRTQETRRNRLVRDSRSRIADNLGNRGEVAATAAAASYKKPGPSACETERLTVSAAAAAAAAAARGRQAADLGVRPSPPSAAAAAVRLTSAPSADRKERAAVGGGRHSRRERKSFETPLNSTQIKTRSAPDRTTTTTTLQHL